MKALVLSGGSEKGAYQSGCIKYLMGTSDIQYDALAGVSVGAINIAFLAQWDNNKNKEAVESFIDLWQNLTNDKIYKRWKPFGKWHALWRQSFMDSSPLAHLVRSTISLEKIRAMGKKVAVGAVSISSGKYKVFTQDDDDFIDAVIASASFPGFFSPIKMRGEAWIDGGSKEHTPIQMAINLGAEDIDVIMTSPETRLKHFIEEPNITDIIKRSLDLSSEKIMSNDFDKLVMYNKLAEAGITNKKVIKTNIIRPQYNLTDDLLDFDPIKIAKMMDIGYEDAKRVMESKNAKEI
jgi:NTE family protein